MQTTFIQQHPYKQYNSKYIMSTFMICNDGETNDMKWTFFYMMTINGFNECNVKN